MSLKGSLPPRLSFGNQPGSFLHTLMDLLFICSVWFCIINLKNKYSTHSEHCRGTLEQGTKAPDAQNGPCNELATCPGVCPACSWDKLQRRPDPARKTAVKRQKKKSLYTKKSTILNSTLINIWNWINKCIKACRSIKFIFFRLTSQAFMTKLVKENHKFLYATKCHL